MVTTQRGPFSEPMPRPHNPAHTCVKCGRLLDQESLDTCAACFDKEWDARLAEKEASTDPGALPEWQADMNWPLEPLVSPVTPVINVMSAPSPYDYELKQEWCTPKAVASWTSE